MAGLGDAEESSSDLSSTPSQAVDNRTAHIPAHTTPRLPFLNRSMLPFVQHYIDDHSIRR